MKYDRRVVIAPGLNIHRALSCLDNYIRDHRDDGRKSGARHGVPYIFGDGPNVDAYYVYHSDTSYFVTR